MKIINTYLIPIVKNYGNGIVTELREVVLLENGMVFEIQWFNGNKTFQKMDTELFYNTLKTNLLKFV